MHLPHWSPDIILSGSGAKGASTDIPSTWVLVSLQYQPIDQHDAEYQFMQILAIAGQKTSTQACLPAYLEWIDKAYMQLIIKYKDWHQNIRSKVTGPVIIAWNTPLIITVSFGNHLADNEQISLRPSSYKLYPDGRFYHQLVAYDWLPKK